MGEWTENAALLLKDSLSFCDSFDAQTKDQNGFTVLKEYLDSLLGLSSIPKALASQVKRTNKLVDRLSLGENDIDKGMAKVQESLTRMHHSLLKKQGVTESETPKPAKQEETQSKSNSVTQDTTLEIGNFKRMIQEYESDKISASIDMSIKLEEWQQQFSSLALNNMATLTTAVREELLNNPDFHPETLRRFLPIVSDIFSALDGDNLEDISEEFISAIFEIEDSYIIASEVSNSENLQKEIPNAEEIKQDTENTSLLDNSEEGENDEEESKESVRPVINADIVEIPEENYDLLMQFIENQGDVLALFEALSLNYDDNPDEFGDEIKGILHSWKGEFGVLDLQKFSQLCHFLEDEMDKKETFRSDTLFRFKDLLTFKFKEIKNGAAEILLTDEEIAYLVNFNDESVEEDFSVEESISTIGDIVTFDEAAEYPNTPDVGLLHGFITESHEHLDIADAAILELEKNGKDSETVDSVFRAYHTIKGVASFLNLEPIRFLAHEIENFIDLIRNDAITLDQNAINIALEGTDFLKHCILEVAGSVNEDSYRLPTGINRFLQKLQTILQVVENVDFNATLDSDSASKDIPKPIEKTVIKAENKVLPNLDALLTEELTDVEKMEARKVTSKSRIGNISETVRVPVDRLDLLIDTIGEAVIAQSMVVADETISAIKKPELVKKIAQAEQIMRQVQELSMSMRMVSIKPTFQKMARLVRDLSLKFDKKIEFVMEGQDTDIDKSLVENIGDPLIHMVRNAMDHGIENSVEERLALGKPEKATVILRAFHKSGSIYIEIEDDGRGLDTEKILEKAIKQGLVRPEQELTENEIFNLIFKPGFSTAQKITDISGRGVGMDVVRRNITDMRGAIHVSSELGKGTTFSIRLPLTLAIIDGMVVRACGERYIIPKLSIVESLIPTTENLETVLGNSGQLIKFRGSYLVFQKLEDIFELSGKSCESIENRGVIVVIEDLNGNRVGLYVDEILGQQQVVIKNLGEGMINIDGIAGGAIMSDGSVNLIIDVSSVVSIIQ